MRDIYRAVRVITVYVQVVISEVLRFIIGRYNCNTSVFNISDILLPVNNFHLICCRDCVVNLSLIHI